MSKPADVPIRIFAMDVKLIYNEEQVNVSNHQIELNEPNGIYYLELQSAEETKTYKLIKSN